MTRLFGTDGVRGVANTELSCELAYKMGQAAARYLGGCLVLGKDTRQSCDMLEGALIAGACSQGADVYRAGIIPTPAVALLSRELGCDGGIVISASHNPAQYNGIKFFNGQGYKLGVNQEDQVEAFLHTPVDTPEQIGVRPVGAGVGRVLEFEDARERYISHAVETLADEGIDLKGIKVALDCAHGASSVTSADALRRLGAQVFVINDDYNGIDINDGCGSTHLDAIKRFTAETGADVGLAHDGDADRLMAVDEQGNEVDGDMIEAICAVQLAEQGKLAGMRVVSTVMCNLGFTLAMREHGFTVDQTPVGDKHVLARMLETGAVIGGEQSGHIIFLEHNSTGDGLITACQLLAAMRRSGEPLSVLSQVMTRYPQELINVRTVNKNGFADDPSIQEVLAAVEERLDGRGRVLLRASGTEPLVRVMVEAATQEVAACEARALANVVAKSLDGEVL